MYGFLKRLLVFAFFGSYIFVPDQTFSANGNRNRNCIFSFLSESQGSRAVKNLQQNLFLGTGHKVQGGWAGRNRGWVINFQADEKGWVT